MKPTKPLRLLSVLAVLFLLLTACGSDDGDDSSSDTTGGDAGDTTGTSIPDGPTIVIRGQDFSESATIAQVYGQYLQGLGYDVEIETPAGFRTEALAALGSGDLNLIVDYIGGTQAELAPEAEPSADPSQVMTVISPLLTQLNTTVLDFSPATDGDALVVRGDSEATTISDLAGLDYVFGAAAQCYERPQCYIGLTDPDGYGIEFASTETIEFGPLLGEALAASEVDAVVWNTTAPQITEEGFKVLEDDLGLFPAQNIAPMVSTEVLRIYGDPLRFALNDLSAALTTEDLLEWNTATDIDFEEPDAVASAVAGGERLLLTGVRGGRPPGRPPAARQVSERARRRRSGGPRTSAPWIEPVSRWSPHTHRPVADVVGAFRCERRALVGLPVRDVVGPQVLPPVDRRAEPGAHLSSGVVDQRVAERSGAGRGDQRPSRTARTPERCCSSRPGSAPGRCRRRRGRRGGRGNGAAAAAK